MNYYAILYTDNYIPDNIKIHISVIEGIYDSNLRQKARVIGNINITDNIFYKHVKHPYNVINIGENTITLKKSYYNDETHSICHEQTYTLLSHLLITEGYTQEKIAQIITAINNISNNRSIKTHIHYLENYVTFLENQ